MIKRTSIQKKLLLNPLVILLVGLIIITLYKSNTNNLFATSSFTVNWNIDNLDITENHNALRTLILLETKQLPDPITPLPSEVLQKPINYYGQYLQFSGTIKSLKLYNPHNNLESITIGNSLEMLMLTNDGTTMLDCFLIGYNSNLAPEENVTVMGYCPGLRYVKTSQGIVSAYLALIGNPESQNPPSNNLNQSPTLPATSNSISPVSPNS